MDVSAQARVGTRFAGRYDVAEVLGEGGMGAVYRARHAFTGAEVALKIMHAGVARSQNARERFLREAQAPSSIGHPGIVKVTDAGVADDGTLYLALELLDGEDLGKAVERGGVDGAAVVAITMELLDSLGAAHVAGLVHRDIKPENVFLSRSGDAGSRVRLLDFGITRQVTDTADSKLTQTGTILGTPHYMSPEQARGQPVDARSDIYSVGGMVFYALTGRPPFTAENYNLLIVAIMTHPAPPIRSVRPEIPADVAAVVDRALAHDRSARYASAAQMRDALAACATPTLAAIRPEGSAATGYEATMPSDVGIPVAIPITPIVQPAPSPVALGATTEPTPARTPPSGIPPTQGMSAVAALSPSVQPSKRRSRAGLVVVLVVVLGALVGGGLAAFTLVPSGDATEDPPADPTPPAVITTSVNAEADAAMVPTEAPESVEARLAELEARTLEAEARAAEVERERLEEEEARTAAARRAAMRRAEQRAEEESMARVAMQRCNTQCSIDLARCRRESGGMGLAATECHTAWSRCLATCR